MIIGSSTYAFSIVVALFLIGLAGGAWVIGRKDQSAHLRATILKVEALTALSLYLSLFVVNLIPGLLVNMGLRLQIASWAGLLALQIIVTALLILLPAFLMGMVMPLVLFWASTNKGGAVALVGRSYAINTIGAISAAFVTGFILIPRTSTKFTLIVASAICLLIAGAAYQPSPSIGDAALRRSLSVGLTLALVVVLVIMAPPMNLADLSIGAYDSLIRVLAQSREGITNEEKASSDAHRLLMYEEGPTSTVSVRRDADTISMAINGRTNASDSVFDMPTQVMLAQVPMLVAPKLDNGLIIDLPQRSVWDVAVADRQLPVLSWNQQQLKDLTSSIANNQPLNIANESDYRRRELTQSYTETVRFYREEPSSMCRRYTFHSGFFLGRERLSEQGVSPGLQIISCQRTIAPVLGLTKVFPHVCVSCRWCREGGLILVGSNQPLSLDLLAQRLADERIAKELSRVNLRSEAMCGAGLLA